MEYLCPCFKSLPRSTKDKYILDTYAIDILGRRPQMTKSLQKLHISQEDLDELMIGLSYHAGKYFRIAKIILAIMYISLWIMLPYIVYLGITNSDFDRKHNPVVYILLLLGIWLFGLSICLALSNYAESKVRQYLVKVNQIKYKNRSGYWKVGKFVRYLELHSRSAPTNNVRELRAAQKLVESSPQKYGKLHDADTASFDSV